MTSPTPLVQLRGVSVSFPGVKALDDVDFRMFPGEVHSLMGENGAGKSTLIKALTGVHRIDAAAILLEAAPGLVRARRRPARRDQHRLQEVNLLPNLSVAENILLGREPRQLRRRSLGAHARARPRSARRPRARHRPGVAALRPLAGRPAARRDRPGDRPCVQGARPRRTDLEPRQRRGHRTLPRDPRPQGRGRRHPVHLALPRAGLRDLRPTHGAAQRRAGRRVPHARTARGSTSSRR